MANCNEYISERNPMQEGIVREKELLSNNNALSPLLKLVYF